MKLVTYLDPVARQPRAGVWNTDGLVWDAATLLGRDTSAPFSLIDLLNEGEPALQTVRNAAHHSTAASAAARTVHSADLASPIPAPPSVRDFYAFEQHVKAARALRNVPMIPEWYQIPVFYFSNPAAIQGPEADVEYPADSRELDIELEIAIVIGKEGRNIAAADAAQYIAGYTIMNDWSARDLQRDEMKMNLGPAKGKDFATSLGPWLVTPDELAEYRIGSGAEERYNLNMYARINGQQISHGNFKDIYFTFARMIERASRHVTLRVGDVIGSGTVGTGCILELTTSVHRWLLPGDTIELEIDGLGVLRNTIIPEAHV